MSQQSEQVPGLAGMTAIAEPEPAVGEEPAVAEPGPVADEHPEPEREPEVDKNAPARQLTPAEEAHFRLTGEIPPEQ
ncbi:MAG: hypothetical protein ACYCV4_05410 [Dermatophilaceae bacterium]